MHSDIFYSFHLFFVFFFLKRAGHQPLKLMSLPQFEKHVVGNWTDLHNQARTCGGFKRPAALPHGHEPLINSSVVTCFFQCRI